MSPTISTEKTLKNLPINEQCNLIPRIIRLQDAPFYLGMKRDQFNRIVRPKLEVIPIGKRGIGFDRLDLDAWVEHHKLSVAPALYRGDKVWEQEDHQDSLSDEESGELTKLCSDDVFAKALALVNSKRQKNT